MIKRGLVLVSALTFGAFAAHAEGMISPTGLSANATSVTVGSVTADKDGYVVVHMSDTTGAIAGEVIGNAPVKAGKNSDVAVKLEKKLKPGAKLIVMLHEEGDNNTKFDAADKPATAGRGPVQQVVTVE